jgi:hypothetical protein
MAVRGSGKAAVGILPGKIPFGFRRGESYGSKARDE